MNHQKSVLIFRLGSIGDTVVALPCFHAIARKFAGQRRILLTNKNVTMRASSAETVLGEGGWVDEVMYYAAGESRLQPWVALLRAIRDRRVEILVYLADRPKVLPVCRDLLFFKAAGIRRIVGAHLGADYRVPLTDPATGELEQEPRRLARCVASEVVVDLSPPNWDLRLSRAEHHRAENALAPLRGRGPIVALAPGAKVARKDWGERNWGALIESLQVLLPGVSLVTVGAPDERPLAQRLLQLWSGPSVNTSGSLTPREMAALLGRCDLLVCHDSGPMHLAAALQTPCVALFGDYNRPRRWYPFGPGHRVIHEPRGVTHIEPAHVAREVAAALDELKRATNPLTRHRNAG